MSSNQAIFYKLPIEILHYILGYMTEKDQLNFALTCSWTYRVFRVYHVGYASPKWFPINITQVHRSTETSSYVSTVSGDHFNYEPTNIPDTPPAANYRDGVLLDGKLYLTIFEKDSPICWILNFDEIPLSWKRVNVIFAESESEEDSEGSSDADDKKSDIDIRMPKLKITQYQPLRSTVAAAISPMIYFFGGECLTTGEHSGTLYKLDTRSMVLRKVIGQDGNLPSARKMHSLNVIDNKCLALFGGRCLLINDSDYLREFDSKDFYVYDISTKIWTGYQDLHDHVPYARSFHSTTVIKYSLYIYGGQQITSSSTPNSRIHDDDDLWCFTFNSQQEDSADEGQDTPLGSTSSRESNRSGASRISSSFKQEKWQKFFSPRNFTSPAFSCGMGGEWHTTTGNNVGRRCGAAMFNVGKRVAVLGGYERDNWKWSVGGNEKEKTSSSVQLPEKEEIRDLGKSSDEHSEDIVREYGDIEKPWELCKLYLPDRKRWDQVRIPNFPEMECIAITTNSNVFVMGRKKGDTEEQGITMGWIREDFSNI